MLGAPGGGEADGTWGFSHWYSTGILLEIKNEQGFLQQPFTGINKGEAFLWTRELPLHFGFVTPKEVELWILLDCGCTTIRAGSSGGQWCHPCLFCWASCDEQRLCSHSSSRRLSQSSSHLSPRPCTASVPAACCTEQLTSLTIPLYQREAPCPACSRNGDSIFFFCIGFTCKSLEIRTLRSPSLPCLSAATAVLDRCEPPVILPASHSNLFRCLSPLFLDAWPKV